MFIFRLTPYNNKHIFISQATSKPRRLLSATDGANANPNESKEIDMDNLTQDAPQVKTPVTSAVFDLSPAAELGRGRAIARLQRLVKRDAKRGDYGLANKWLDAIQTLETINHV